MRTSWLERGGFWDKGKKQAEKPELPVIREIPVESIRPNPAQPRLSYESGALEELAESIRENGLIQPILVRQLLDGDYELIAGHRRWMAVRKLGQPTIRAIVENRTDTESAVLALVENIQRRDLDCMEEARAIAGLIESTGMTQQEAARRGAAFRASCPGSAPAGTGGGPPPGAGSGAPPEPHGGTDRSPGGRLSVRPQGTCHPHCPAP